MNTLEALTCLTTLVENTCENLGESIQSDDISKYKECIKTLREALLFKGEFKAEVTDINLWMNKSDAPEFQGLIKNGVLGVDWAGNIGWGRWELILDDDGIPHIYTECMDTQADKKFSRMILSKILEKAVIEE